MIHLADFHRERTRCGCHPIGHGNSHWLNGGSLGLGGGPRNQARRAHTQPCRTRHPRIGECLYRHVGIAGTQTDTQSLAFVDTLISHGRQDGRIIHRLHRQCKTTPDAVGAIVDLKSDGRLARSFHIQPHEQCARSPTTAQDQCRVRHQFCVGTRHSHRKTPWVSPVITDGEGNREHRFFRHGSIRK